LLTNLELNETIPKEEIKLIVNKSVAINNLIESKEDETNEGMKIVNYLNKTIVNHKYNGINMFGDIKMAIFNGYVHLARKGIKVDDVINQNDLPNLKYFKWQYGIPIDYDTLKYLLFQNDFQKKIKRDIEEQKEAEKIFSQEYIIALQPEPQYQMWVIKRLIMMWYADDFLQTNIRKIKILINQWRGVSDQKFNKQYGVLPSIVIYPRYGKTSAKKVLKLITNYFILYQNIGWSYSQPSYFVKINDLIWYTNGSLDLKLYFRKTLSSYDGKIQNTSFDEYYSGFISADKIMFEPL
jgi:hypothetical protein